jgi:hypothetical protein
LRNGLCSNENRSLIPFTVLAIRVRAFWRSEKKSEPSSSWNWLGEATEERLRLPAELLGWRVLVRQGRRFRAEVRARVDTMIEKSFQILVGGANGADKAVQRYLAHNSTLLILSG